VARDITRTRYDPDDRYANPGGPSHPAESQPATGQLTSRSRFFAVPAKEGAPLADGPFVIAASVGLVVAGTALRAVIDVADEALDVAASEDRLLVRGVSGITTVLGDGCTITLHPVAPGDLPAAASTHSDAVQADVERLIGDPPGVTTTRRYSVDEPSGAWLRQHDLQQCVIAPILQRSQVIGTLVTTRAMGRDQIGEVDLQFIAAMADIVGIAVQAARVRNDAMISLEELRQQVEVTENISDALVVCDPTHLIIGWNGGAAQIYGYSREEALGCHLFTLLATEFFTSDGAAGSLDQVVADLATTNHWRGELHERRADGTPLITLASFTQMVDRRQRPTALVVVGRDITTQRHEEYQATHDALTGLPNRRMLNSRLYEVMARAYRTDRPLAVVFIDLDGFKPINDTFGHGVGDAVLATVAKRLGSAVRSRDTVGRLGGDEFLVILEEAGSRQDVARTVERISSALAEPITIGVQTMTVLPSIGVCMSDHPGRDTLAAERLLNLADQAMYAAKREKCGAVFVDASDA
jgi:diguanylate cyclase (GGDEF)-like protein/PAS domain S-box-containing protein